MMAEVWTLQHLVSGEMRKDWQKRCRRSDQLARRKTKRVKCLVN